MLGGLEPIFKDLKSVGEGIVSVGECVHYPDRAGYLLRQKVEGGNSRGLSYDGFLQVEDEDSKEGVGGHWGPEARDVDVEFLNKELKDAVQVAHLFPREQVGWVIGGCVVGDGGRGGGWLKGRLV